MSSDSWTKDPRSYHSNPPDAGLVGAIAKKLGPWITLGTIVVGIVAWGFAAGVKTETFATKSEVATVAASDVAAQRAIQSQLTSIADRLGGIEAHQAENAKNLDELRKDVRELRSTAGVRVTSPGAK